MRKNKYSIAVIEGDGIGKEVMPEGIRCLEAVSSKYGINLEFKNYDFSSVDYYETVSYTHLTLPTKRIV